VKKVVIGVVAFIAVGVAAFLALPLAPPDSVLCVGSCKQNAKRKFELLYSYYMDVATTCDGPTASRRILEELSPDLAATVDEKNAKFAKLAVKEKNETLTVQERKAYENDPWRVVPFQGNLMYHQLFQEKAKLSEASPVVTSCNTDGFMQGRSGYVGYCESYTHLAVIYSYEGGDLGVMRSTPNVVVLSEAKNDLFDRLKGKGILSARLEELREISLHDVKALEAAEEEVAASFAADIPADEVVGAVGAKFYELRCKSWAKQFTLAHD